MRSWKRSASFRSTSPGGSPRPWRGSRRSLRTARKPDSSEFSRMATLSVAVVGSGPAGLYTAEALLKQAAALDPPCQIAVDVLDRLPTPYGLVRYGVAPDHPSIKSIAEYLRRVLEGDDVRFLGGVRLGGEVTREDLLGCYDAVVYATGAMRDRHMGIDGEDLPGSYAATDFVNWYCGHPDSDAGSFTLDAESVAVVGVGNVAVDVARVLIRDPDELRRTDVSQPALSRPGQIHHQGAAGTRGTRRRRHCGRRRRGGPGRVRRHRRQRRAGRVRPPGARQPGRDRRLGGPSASRAQAAAGAAVLAAPGPGGGHRARHRADCGADQDRRERVADRDGGAGDDPGADGAAQRGVPERAAAGGTVRRAQPHRAERRGPGARARRGAAAPGVRRRLAQARPHRGHRHQQVRRGPDGPGSAGRPVPGRRAGR